VPFIIMEYVEGHTLRELMHDGAALPIDEAVDITIGVLSALQYAHHAGIVHRDIKPGNIMLTVAGQVKVMDFGIARALAETSDAVTQTQAVIGTAQYLSPEQARGETVDARSDLYSTGCVLFELLTGRPPFVGDSAVAVAYQHVREHAEPPSVFAPDVPPALDQVVMKALSKNRETRYSTASEFLADLQAFKLGSPVSAPPVSAAAATEATQVIAPAPLPPVTVPPTASYPPAGPSTTSFENAGILPPSDEVEDEEARARRKKRVLIWSIVGAVAVIAVAVGLFFVLRGKPQAPPGPTAAPMATVPEVPASRTVEDSIKAIEDAKFKAAPGTPVFSTQVPKDQVVRFDPGSGKKAERGSTVKYIVSLGADEATVPATEGMTQADARAALEKAGLKVADQNETVNSAKVAKDLVVGTKPPVNTQMKAGDEVVLQISNGKTTVPNCAGKTEDQCRTLLDDAGLKYDGTDEEESEQVPGTVIRTEPGADQVADQGAKVRIVVAKAAATVTLPDMAGWTAKAARDWLNSNGMQVNQVNQSDSSVAKDVVISTEPSADTVLRPGQTVTITVSTGSPAPNPTPT
jgi:serine/threonine-protein kinase